MGLQLSYAHLNQLGLIYLRGDDGLHNSFVFEYLDSVYDIARDFLVDRCIDQLPVVSAGLPPFSNTGVVKPLRRD